MSAGPPRLVIASGNVHKVEEIGALLGESGRPSLEALELVSMAALAGSPPEIEESADSFEGNAVLKAEGIAAWLRGIKACRGDLVLADDSGLCVAAFDGGPGVFSARFAGEACDDRANNAKLVAELSARGLASSAAEYACVLALCWVDGRAIEGAAPLSGSCLIAEGRCSGRVRLEARGEGGFGYDPHFWVDGDSRTFAQLSQTQKAARSHRGAAVRRLIEILPGLRGL